MKQLLFLLLMYFFHTEVFSKAMPFSYGGDRRRYTIYLLSIYPLLGCVHSWPGSHPFTSGFSLGKTKREIDTNDLIWTFFSAHTWKGKTD
jgi:poly(3-hydroxybutyrate) depolymerase